MKWIGLTSRLDQHNCDTVLSKVELSIHCYCFRHDCTWHHLAPCPRHTTSAVLKNNLVVLCPWEVILLSPSCTVVLFFFFFIKKKTTLLIAHNEAVKNPRSPGPKCVDDAAMCHCDLFYSNVAYSILPKRNKINKVLHPAFLGECFVFLDKLFYHGRDIYNPMMI